MATDLFQIAAVRAQVLEDYKIRFESLLERAEAAEKDTQAISLPEFEAFGWNRLEEFMNRFEESVNSPLLERMRGILENVEVTLDSQRIEKLKAGLAVRREGLVEIARQTTQELEKIDLPEIREKAREDIGSCIEEGRWDDLIQKVSSWCQLEQQVASIAGARDRKTLLYNAVFDLALKEGQSTSLIQKVTEVEGLAHELGGDLLKQQVRFEIPESSTNPMNGVEANLRRIAQEREEIRQLQGEDIDFNKLTENPTTLKEIIEILEKRHTSAEKDFRQNRSIAGGLLDKHNSLAMLLGRNPVSMLDNLNLRKLGIFAGDLQASIDRLLEELERSLTPDARVFIECMIDGKLPPNWDAQRTFSAIQELLGKGFFFEVKRRED